MLNITYKDRRTNIWVRERKKLIDIIYTVRKMKWSWAGHINRLKDDRCTSRVTTRRPYDTEIRLGRPAKRRRDDLDKYWSETIWQRTAQDRGIRHDHVTQRLPNDDDDEIIPNTATSDVEQDKDIIPETVIKFLQTVLTGKIDYSQQLNRVEQLTNCRHWWQDQTTKTHHVSLCSQVSDWEYRSDAYNGLTGLCFIHTNCGN